MQKDILSMTFEELAEAISEIGEKGFRAKQIFMWLHEKRVNDFSEMTNLSKPLRESLGKHFLLFPAKIVDVKISSKDMTRKYLLELSNNTIIESVLMNYEYGMTVCVSSQAGCKMGCAFCASQPCGFHRDLTAGEMLSQIYAIENDTGLKAGRAVIMGSGEPFDNFSNTMRFIGLLNSKNGHNMGMRHITVSTCGVVPNIYEFAKLNPQANLAVSLHAPNDSVRNSIMPISIKYPFEELMKACSYYTKRTNRRITFEYILIEGVNDGLNHARELSEVLEGMLCHVNLIPANEVRELAVKAGKNAHMFAQILCGRGINATVRRTLGEDIGGACGQLRSYFINGSDSKRC